MTRRFNIIFISLLSILSVFYIGTTIYNFSNREHLYKSHDCSNVAYSEVIICLSGNCPLFNYNCTYNINDKSYNFQKSCFDKSSLNCNLDYKTYNTKILTYNYIPSILLISLFASSLLTSFIIIYKLLPDGK